LGEPSFSSRENIKEGKEFLVCGGEALFFQGFPRIEEYMERGKERPRKNSSIARIRKKSLCRT